MDLVMLQPPHTRRGVRYSEPRGLMSRGVTRGVRSTSPRGVACITVALGRLPFRSSLRHLTGDGHVQQRQQHLMMADQVEAFRRGAFDHVDARTILGLL